MEILTPVFTETSWSPYVVGVGIGILSWLTFLISGKPISTSTTFARVGGMMEKLISGEKAGQRPYYQKIKLEINWQWMLVTGIVLGSFLSAFISDDLHANAWVPTLWATAFGDSEVLRIVVAMAGGVLLGFGARFADGCTSGHGISGTLQLAVSSWISVVFFFIGGVLTAQFIYRFIA